MGKDTIHLVMRFADGFMASSIVSTVAEHQAVIMQHGAVWYGKVGKTLASHIIGAIHEQLAAGIPTYAILVQKVGSEYEGFQGTIAEVAKTLPRGAKKLVPPYYDKNDITRKVTVWTKLTSISAIQKGNLKGYRVASSGRPLLSSLRKSMAGNFVVKEGEGIDY